MSGNEKDEGGGLEGERRYFLRTRVACFRHLPHAAPAGIGADLLHDPTKIAEKSVCRMPVGIAVFRHGVDDEASAGVQVVPENARAPFC